MQTFNPSAISANYGRGAAAAQGLPMGSGNAMASGALSDLAHRLFFFTMLQRLLAAQGNANALGGISSLATELAGLQRQPQASPYGDQQQAAGPSARGAGMGTGVGIGGAAGMMASQPSSFPQGQTTPISAPFYTEGPRGNLSPWQFPMGFYYNPGINGGYAR